MRKHAAISLTYKPATQGSLIQGLIHVIFAEGLQDKALEEQNRGLFDKLRELSSKHTPEHVSEKTGIPADTIKEAARTVAGAGAASIVFGRGITSCVCGYRNSMALTDLSLITGNVGRPGGGVNPMAAKAGEQGACDMGALPDRLPGYRTVASDEDRKRLGSLWKAELPKGHGLTVGEMVDAALSGGLQALYVVGADLAFELPERHKTIEALGKLGLLVVQDIFMSETAAMAHVVLPAVSFAEKEGTFTNSERRVQRIRPVMKPVGESKPDGEIISMVSARMGRPIEWRPSLVMDRINVSTPIYSGITYDLLADGGVQWPYYEEMKSGTEILYSKGYDSKRAAREADIAHKVTAALAAKNELAEGFSFHADITTSLYHSGTTTRRTKGPNMVVGKAFAAINPDDARGLGVADGGTVTIRSRTGFLKLPVKIDDQVPKGIVHIPDHFQDHGCNALTAAVLDPVNKVLAARFWPVFIEA
jgi:predicted molibdopterin-dependent oxidoreductase YjgC